MVHKTKNIQYGKVLWVVMLCCYEKSKGKIARLAHLK